jgi:transposase
MPLKTAGQFLWVGDSRMWQMILAHVRAAHARIPLEDLVLMLAYEINGRKGQNYLTVSSDLMAKKMLVTTPGRESSIWGLLLRNCSYTTPIPEPSNM